VQTWVFADRDHITIGRSEDRDVCIAHQVVSRIHAELRFVGGRWRIISLGRNSITIDDVTISESDLENRSVFRLAAGGPLMRFEEGARSSESLTTISDEGSWVQPSFKIDEERKRREVAEIADADYFKKLKLKAKELKQSQQS